MQIAYLGNKPSCLFRELFDTHGYLRHQSMLIQGSNKSLKSPRSETLAFDVDGCSETRNHEGVDICPENHTKTYTLKSVPLVLKLGQTDGIKNPSSPTKMSSSTTGSSTITSKSSGSLSASSTSYSSLASQRTTDNSTRLSQAASEDFTSGSCASPDISTAVLPATASPSKTNTCCDRFTLTPSAKIQDQKNVINGLPSATMASLDTNLACSKAPGPSSPIDSTAGTVFTSGASTSGSDSCPRMILNNPISPSPTVTESIPPFVQTAENFTATSSHHDHIPSMHCKKIADDCFAELNIPLPTELERKWDQKICNPLCDLICRSVDAEVTVECVMARSTSNGRAMPTILLMCSMQKHKDQIEKILNWCNYIPNSFSRKVVVLDNRRCTNGLKPESRVCRRSSTVRHADAYGGFGSSNTTMNAQKNRISDPIRPRNEFIYPQNYSSERCFPVPSHFHQYETLLDYRKCGPEVLSSEHHVASPDDKIFVEMAVEEVGMKPVVFGSLAKFLSNANITTYSTIGGVILISGTLYGLTTAHGIHDVSTPWPEASRFSGTSSKFQKPIHCVFAHALKISPLSDMSNTQSGPVKMKATEQSKLEILRLLQIGHWYDCGLKILHSMSSSSPGYQSSIKLMDTLKTKI